MSAKKVIAALAPQFNRVDHIFENVDLDKVLVCVQPEGSTAWSVAFYELVNTEHSGGKGGMRRVDAQFIRDQVWLRLTDARFTPEAVITKGFYHVQGTPLRRHIFNFEMVTIDFNQKLQLKSVKTQTGFELLETV